MQRFFRLLQLDKKDIYYVYVYGAFAGLINLSLPLGIQAVIGLIAGGSLSASLFLLVTVVTVATALSGLLVVMQLAVTETIQRRIFARSAFEFAFRIPHFRLSAMTRVYAPELVNRFFDTMTVQKGIPKILIDFSTAALNILFGLVLIAFYHPFFAFFGLSLILVLYLIFRITGPRGLSTSLRESKYKYEVAHWLEELARAVNTFKLWSDTRLPLKKTDYLVSNYLDNRKQHFRVLLTQYGSILAFKVIVTATLLFLGSYLVIDNQINIGQFVAAEIVVILMLSSVEKVIISMNVIYDMLTAIEKLGDVTDLPLETEEGVRFEEIDTGKGVSIDVDKLYFKYEDAERPTIDNLFMKIEAGERVCITGYNRSGKATLIQIVAGLYSDFQGSVSYNGIPFRNLNLSSLRRNIGDYCSEEDIFKGTILENISMGSDDIKLEDVIRAAESIGLNEYIKRLPDGYQTILQPGGKNVPRSVRTKIMLARSIVKRPKLQAVEGFWLNLEPSEREVIADFLTSREHNWTLLIATDDPIIASKCDRIIILNDGKIIDSGTFPEIQKSTHFRKIFRGTYEELDSNSAGSF